MNRERSFKIAIYSFIFIIILNFILPRMMRGNPIAYLTGMDEASLSVAQYEYYEKALHLDKNIFIQFLYYLKSLVDGTLGYSFKKQSYVAPLVLARLKVTLLLVLPSAILAAILGLVLGLRGAYNKNKYLERTLTPVMVILNAVPLFLLSLLLIMTLSFSYKLFPYSGLGTGFLDRVYHLVLPVLAITLALLPSRYLLVRNMGSEKAKSKSVLYASQRGLRATTIRYSYILPEIISAYITNVGLSIGSGIAGSVIVEKIFSINGMGSLLNEAIFTLDYPLLQGILFITTLAMLIAVGLTNIFSFLIDPRERRRNA